MRSFVFVFRRVQRELAHVFHVYLLTIFGAVNTLCDVPKFSISQTDKTMRHHANLCGFRKLHRHLVMFWQLLVIVCLWVEDVFSPKSYDSQSATAIMSVE